MYTPHRSVLSHQVAGVDGPVISLGMYRPDLVATLAAGLPGGVLHTGHRRIAFSRRHWSSAPEWWDTTSSSIPLCGRYAVIVASFRRARR